MKKYILLSFLSLMIFACKEDGIMTFDPNSDFDGIYFQNGYDPTSGSNRGDNFELYDSSTYSFAGRNIIVKDYLASFPVRLMGNTKDYDRKINFKIDKDHTTAVEGEDFEINYDTTYLAANESTATIYVRILRTDKLLTKSLCLALELEESEGLKLLMHQYNSSPEANNSNAVKYMANIYKVAFHEKTEEPRYWSSSRSNRTYFGTWSAKKYTILNGLMDWTPKMWEEGGQAGSPVGAGIFPYAAFQLQSYLQAKADSGEPVKEADGSFMQLAGVYLVDYSALENK